jgi:hypothetical protein
MVDWAQYNIWSWLTTTLLHAALARRSSGYLQIAALFQAAADRPIHGIADQALLVNNVKLAASR